MSLVLSSAHFVWSFRFSLYIPASFCLCVLDESNSHLHPQQQIVSAREGQNRRKIDGEEESLVVRN